ncbi:hypothetical protein Taro_039026 [Colocasia esculenta]|uniref:CW-type domain-containing protein n=1 Tax=Colocasia esculenta TaxID=4460 RepID=A0A843WEI9_COLES|nr:hypothetical protein [Colocasia esculenta]
MYPSNYASYSDHPEEISSYFKCSWVLADPSQQNCVVETPSRFQTVAPQKGHTIHKNFVRTDPSYLVTLSQAHSGWIFGGIAELVDNARDANASRLDISIELLYLRIMGQKIPVLSIVDNGHGMCHEEVIRMLSFGHKQTNVENVDCIGQFGIGFKTGAMRLGRDAIVLTQTASSRSVALLSQSFNEDKENLEIPIITYSKQGNYMDLDVTVHSQASADRHLQAIKDFSPFNEYVIGQKIGIFGEYGTGTQIYIWNLDRWGSDYSLQWNKVEMSGQQSEGDILIRSRRIRSRPGQISQEVPLDYSLQAYLEVIFLDPRMNIYIQGSLVKSRPLAKSLRKTAVVKGEIMGNPIQLTLGCSQLEWDRMNCGMFLYWRGRLIEAYKRVGGMVHNADMGRGVLGVVDVTNIMKDRNGRVWVLNNKQGFQDCEAYAKLEEWLGNRSDEYWDDHFDTLHLQHGNANYKPDDDWVQCNKCRKWRVLPPNFDSHSLPPEWFCYMPPFNGMCEIPEQQVADGVITVSAKRSGFDSQIKAGIALLKEEDSVEEKHEHSKQSTNDFQKKRARDEVACKDKSSLIRNDLKSEGCHASQGRRSGEASSKVSIKLDSLDDCVDISAVENTAKRPVLKRLRRGPARSCRRS